MPRRLCLGCGRLTKGRSYCRACSVRRERQKRRNAPWLALYGLPAWNKTKWAVHRRDGYRCTYVDARGRCRADAETATIEAHHLIKVRELWLMAGKDMPTFLELALDRSKIVTLCYKHHRMADRPGKQPPARASAVQKTARRRAR